jgi:aldehyde:ferredoxin oxidoreductase
VELRDARSIWGINNWETLVRLQEELGDKRVRAASIGQAGENLVRFANISNDMEHFNGRTGMGAVMGSKNLKAVVARGTHKMVPANPVKTAEIARWLNARIKIHPPNVGLSAAGTPGILKAINAGGFLPTRNWREGVFEGADKINWDSYKQAIFHSPGTCWACSVKCKRRVFSNDPKYPLDPKWGGPEYEALAALGSILANDNIRALARGNQLCNLYGLDTISVGNVIAFAMECFEEGILSEADLGGRSLRFGDSDGMLWLIDQIANRQGFGDVLADGVKAAAKRIGRGADRFAFTIKNNDVPFHDCRGKTGVALGVALSSTGADHAECPHDPMFQGEGYVKLAPLGLKEGVKPLAVDAAKVRFFSLGQRAWGINNLLSICNFCSVPLHAMTFDKLVEAVQAITGWDASLFEIMKATERSLVMSRMFNIREGFGREDDRVIRRWHEPMPSGPLEGQRIDELQFREAVNLYYEISGWDKNGVPTPGKLVDLELDWLIYETRAS